MFIPAAVAPAGSGYRQRKLHFGDATEKQAITPDAPAATQEDKGLAFSSPEEKARYDAELAKRLKEGRRKRRILWVSLVAGGFQIASMAASSVIPYNFKREMTNLLTERNSEAVRPSCSPERLKKKAPSLTRVTMSNEQYTAFCGLLDTLTHQELTPENLPATVEKLKAGLKKILPAEEVRRMEKNVDVFARDITPDDYKFNKKLKDTLISIGWICAAVSTLLGLLANDMAFARASNQPSIIWSKVVSVPLLAWLIVDPSMRVRALNGLDGVVAGWGQANKMENDTASLKGVPAEPVDIGKVIQLQKIRDELATRLGRQPLWWETFAAWSRNSVSGRQYDTSMAFSLKELRKRLKAETGQDPSRAELVHAWMLYAAGSGFYTASEPGRYVYYKAKGAKRIWNNGGYIKAMREGGGNVRERWRNGERLQLLTLLPPAPMQRLGATLGLVTNVPMAIYGTDPAMVMNLNLVAAILGLPAVLALLFQTFEDRNSKDPLTRAKNAAVWAGTGPNFYADLHAQEEWAVALGKFCRGIPFQLYQMIKVFENDRKETVEKLDKEWPELPEAQKPASG